MPLAVSVALALALATSAVAPAAPIAGDRLPDAPIGGDPRISVTVVNWGEPVTLLDQSQPAWAHLAANAAPTNVTVTVRTDGDIFRGYVLKLTAPDAFGGSQDFVCSDQYQVIESEVQCTFPVPVTRGVNDLYVVFQAGNMDDGLQAHGQLRGAELQVVTLVEVKTADAGWTSVSEARPVTLKGSQTSALRYRLLNTGDIPFQVSNGCQSGTVYPDQQLLCTLRGPRPGYALAGIYDERIRLEDPAGGQASFELKAAVRVPGVPVLTR